MVVSAALMFGGATLIDLVESLVPGGQTFSLAPGLGALMFASLLVFYGARLPVWVLGALGPIGVAMIAAALASTKGAGDGAVLYMWPVLWQAYFFGRRGAVLIVLCVAVAHACALLAMPAGRANLDSWIDVMSSVAVVGVVVELLSERSHKLLRLTSAEARIDELTRLPNRRGFDERAALELSRSHRETSWLGVVMVDLDHFKRVNDEFGHDIGDLVLSRFADCLGSQLRSSDIAARMGGEEFVVLLPGADLESACAFAERVRERLRRLPEQDFPAVTFSAGATAAVSPENIESLLKRADMALYAAKTRGRNRTVADGATVVCGDDAAAPSPQPCRADRADFAALRAPTAEPILG
jgi:diguanylate cyclase (GGDEF)-like protein